MSVSEELTLLSYGCTESARVYAIFKMPDGQRTSRLVKTPTEDEVFENWGTYDRAFLYSVGVAHGRQYQMEKHRETEIGFRLLIVAGIFGTLRRDSRIPSQV